MGIWGNPAATKKKFSTHLGGGVHLHPVHPLPTPLRSIPVWSFPGCGRELGQCCPGSALSRRRQWRAFRTRRQSSALCWTASRQRRSLHSSSRSRTGSQACATCPISVTNKNHTEIKSVIPRLHDEAGSTSWLYERSSSSFVNVCNITPFKWPDSQLIKPAPRAHDERSTSARRASSSSQLHRVNGV